MTDSLLKGRKKERNMSEIQSENHRKTAIKSMDLAELKAM